MSGGVDSSVTAGLLLEQGYEVTGVTLKLWSEDPPAEWQGTHSCCSLDDVIDARRVADHLGINHYVLNFKDIFKKRVVDYFTEEYLKGRTPNPCIACNRYIKFDGMLQKALAMGFDYVATGHYAKVEPPVETDGRFLLRRGDYSPKDQSYVLYNLTQFQLAHLLLPLGGYTKTQVRELAERMNLKVASKPDSQDICFVENNDYAGFLERYAGVTPKQGNILNTEGEIIGQHKGFWNYTVGQRKGLGVAYGKPLYVVSVDPETNSVVLGEAGSEYMPGLTAKDLNWIAFDGLSESIRVQTRIRYKGVFADSTVTPKGNKVKVVFDVPQRAVTPGQAAVFYKGDLVIGGGTII
jgi:tRNA-specific 2-thiouridylase